MPRAAEQRDRDDTRLGGVPGHQARVPRRADQCRLLRAAAHRRSARDVPVRALTRGPSPAARPRSALRIAESVFTTLAQAIPDDLFAAPAGTSGNLNARRPRPAERSGTTSCTCSSGGGYGGSVRRRRAHQWLLEPSASRRRSRRRCWSSTIPILFERYALRERSGGAGKHARRVGVRLSHPASGAARRLLSYLMDHGRFGPPGLFGGKDGAP